MAPTTASNTAARTDCGPLAGRAAPWPSDEVAPRSRRVASARQAARRHDGGAAGGQRAFVLVGMAREQGLGDDQGDDRVTQELEALVATGPAVGCSLT